MNNPFLTKKDSLVEAVQSAMQDGEIRRQAEALVNEEFGVYSRKAVVREQLAAYDARLEEAYKCMKEGEQIDEISGKLAGSYMTKAREQKKEIQDKVNKGTATRQEFRKGLRRTVGMEVARDKLTGRGMAKVHTKEELADKDYDKDGKIETPKDEVWGSRFRAAKMAGKMEEEQIDEGQVTGPRSYKGSPDRKRKAVQMALGRKHKDHPDWNPRTNPQYSALKLGRKLQKQGVTEEEQIEEVEFSQAEIDHLNSFFEQVAPGRPEPTKGVNPTVRNIDLTDENLEEGRPKKNPTPETSERDARQHIQVIAGRAAAGNTLDFPHNDGSKSKITPAMGRKITSHLQGLKPAERQAAVNKMHASAEGLKV